MNLEKWEERWSMSFNPDKCNSISITRKINKISHNYRPPQPRTKTCTIHYLISELSCPMTLPGAIRSTKSAPKETGNLAFLRCNLQINNTKVKETAYTGLARPALKYCSNIWDPHHHKYIDQLQKVQRRATRFVCNRYYYKASVTDMLNKLAWESLEVCLRRARLVI